MVCDHLDPYSLQIGNTSLTRAGHQVNASSAVPNITRAVTLEVVSERGRGSAEVPGTLARSTLASPSPEVPGTIASRFSRSPGASTKAAAADSISETSSGKPVRRAALLLILATIIYWQIREIDRLLSKGDSTTADLELELLSHISPIGWDNVLLYGEYPTSTAEVATHVEDVSSQEQTRSDRGDVAGLA